MKKLQILLIITGLFGLSNAGNEKKNVHLAISGNIGISNSYIESDNLMHYYFNPTSNVEHKTAPSFGINADFFFGKFAGASAGITYLHLGQTTSKTSVYFDDSQFKHDLETTSLLKYAGPTLVLKGGIQTGRFFALVSGGVMPLYLLDSKVEWKIDGRKVDPGTRTPDVNITWWDVLMSIGVETGFWFGNNGVSIVANYYYGVNSISSGISGEAFNRAFMFGFKYSRKLF